ncbi:AraC family transcriptional regulator [Wukongibacter baidiensis]|uniref:AraC family transcriptional regulator n=1 Tax=Wukongibacter baidiensis TaxID=1723361 RepID=UPI003D7FC550
MESIITKSLETKGYFVTTEVSKEFSMDFHLHDYFEIYLCISGGQHFFIDDTIYEMHQGSLFLINNTETHKTVTQSNLPYERCYIYFDPDAVLPFCSYNSNLLKFFTDRPLDFSHRLQLNTDQYAEMLERLNRLMQLPDGFGKDILEKTYFIELLVFISRLYTEGSSTVDTYTNQTYYYKVKPLLDYINTHLHESIPLSDIAEEMHYSVVYMSRLFKQYTGTTIQKYIIARRINEAKRLLKSGETVTSVCHQVGFNDYSHFIRTFKKMVGVPPMKYAKKKPL